MKALAALAPASAAEWTQSAVAQVKLHGVDTYFALIDQADVDFDANAPEHAESVLVRVAAFSCNYREQARILRTAQLQDRKGYVTLGSEFAGTVVKVGPAVQTLQVGDAVCGNGTVEPGVGSHPGLTTQKASAGLQILHQRKLCRLPPAMPLPVAAAFSVGVQTAYSMVGRLQAPHDAHVAVTAASSNTALIVLKALLARGHEPRCLHALTTSAGIVPHLQALGIEQVCLMPRDGGYDAALQRYLADRALPAFDAVIDPFLDIYLPKLLPYTRRFGRYIYCGVAEQYGKIQADSFAYLGLDIAEVFGQILRKSITLIGNNLGTTADLLAGTQDYLQGRLAIDIDSVVTDGDLQRFVERSYVSTDRIGKVVYAYASV